MRSAIGEDRESRTCRVDSPSSPSTLCRVPRTRGYARFIQSCIVERQAEVRRFWIITILIGPVDSPELHGERYPRQVTLGCPKISHCMSKRRSRLSSSSIVLDYLQFKMSPRRQRRWRWRQRQRRGEWRRSTRHYLYAGVLLPLASTDLLSFAISNIGYVARIRIHVTLKPCNLWHDGLKDLLLANRANEIDSGIRTIENVKEMLWCLM